MVYGIRWTISGRHGVLNINYRYGYELDVDISKVCVLDDVEPVMAFHWKYGYKHEGNFKAIDWKRVMIDYSGIEVRNYDGLNLACSFRSVIWLRNWAVDGGCIWDLSSVDWKAEICFDDENKRYVI